MKKRIIVSAFAFFSLLLMSSCVIQTAVRNPVPARTVTVETWSDEISYNLDLRAVATVFADSRNLEEFEYYLNDYRRGISNLDLNRDGQVDYLRVVELYERDIRLVVIQAVLGYNLFQDVATITVEGRDSRTARVQIIGDPFIYGRNYIMEPVFYRPPVIYASFWAPSYVVWRSPYYWGYFPPAFSSRRPVVTNVYINNIYVNNVVNVNNRYNYQSSVRNPQTVNRMHNSVRRNDFARNNPNQSFNNRNANVSNTRDMQARETNVANRRSTNVTTNTSTNTSTRRSNTESTNRQTTTQPDNNQSTRRSNNPAATQGSSSSSSRNNSNATESSSRRPASDNSSSSNVRQSNSSNSNSSGTSNSRSSNSNSNPDNDSRNSSRR
jgi:hypothetical protein